MREMDITLKPLDDADKEQFKADMSDAFQSYAETDDFPADELILPVEEIENTLCKDGTIGYKAMKDGEIVGGAIISIDGQISMDRSNFYMSSAARRVREWASSFGLKSNGNIPTSWSGKQLLRHSPSATYISTSMYAASKSRSISIHIIPIRILIQTMTARTMISGLRSRWYDFHSTTAFHCGINKN